MHTSQVIIPRICFTGLLAKQFNYPGVGGGPLKTATHRVWLQMNEKCHEFFLALSGLKRDF